MGYVLRNSLLLLNTWLHGFHWQTMRFNDSYNRARTVCLYNSVNMDFITPAKASLNGQWPADFWSSIDNLHSIDDSLPVYCILPVYCRKAWLKLCILPWLKRYLMPDTVHQDHLIAFKICFNEWILVFLVITCVRLINNTSLPWVVSINATTFQINLIVNIMLI